MQRGSRLACWIAARIVRPIVMTYLDIYTDPGEPVADSGTPGYDPRGTVHGQYELAANHEHDTPEIYTETLRFGFTSGGPRDREPAWKSSASAPR